MIAVALVLALSPVMPDPCRLLEARDIARVLGWAVVAGPARHYALPGSAGTMCTFEGRDGSVVVTIPSKGTGVPVNDLTSDLGTLRTPLHDVMGFGVPVELGRGTAIVHDRGRDYGITVQPTDAQFADELQMRALAGALIARLPRRVVRDHGSSSAVRLRISRWGAVCRAHTRQSTTFATANKTFFDRGNPLQLSA